MKIRFAFCSVALLLAGVPSPAQTAAAATPRDIAIVVVDSHGRHSSGMSEFDRVDVAFTSVFNHRKWPAKVTVERMAANSQAHETELRIYLEGIRQDVPGELTFRAWMTLSDHGKETDFGIIQYRYNPRPWQPRDDVLDQVMHGAAIVAADKIEPILFPKPVAPNRVAVD